ncbi:pyruvate carboxylase, mitochondrial [Pelomyxa schiedti]|nr:pyruvate carboxylase, mitochondrial [Pelomyxa schiedti]
MASHNQATSDLNSNATSTATTTTATATTTTTSANNNSGNSSNSGGNKMTSPLLRPLSPSRCISPRPPSPSSPSIFALNGASVPRSGSPGSNMFLRTNLTGTTRGTAEKRPDGDVGAIQLFTSIQSTDFLNFSINNRTYSQQISAAAAAGTLCAISCSTRFIKNYEVMWMEHLYSFIGGSLGCAEGEKLCMGFEHATELGLPAIVVSRSGGARMQEGTLSLMQMAKVSAAVQAFKAQRLPYISVCLDPTYGGTTASYAMQGDIRISVRQARIGFAGENVILNTVYKMNQEAYDKDCPPGFQSAPFVQQHGQLDILVDDLVQVEEAVGKVLTILNAPRDWHIKAADMIPGENNPPEDYRPDYSKSRRADRVQAQDIIEQLFTNFVELQGDGRIGYDRCIRGGIALLDGCPVMIIATYKGHDAISMQQANFGMATPAGYRTAQRLMYLAEHFGIPVVSLVDTPGAYPSFESEVDGQPEAIASNLTTMAGLRVPFITLMVGEGGSGGALAIAMGDRIAMLSEGYYGVITPEGAVSILCRYANDSEKMAKFQSDCHAMAATQRIYPTDLLELGVIDEIIWERDTDKYNDCPETLSKIKYFIMRSIADASNLSHTELVNERHDKFRNMGRYQKLTAQQQASIPVSPPLVRRVTAVPPKTDPKNELSPDVTRLMRFIADVIVNGPNSLFWTPPPSDITPIEPLHPVNPIPLAQRPKNAKAVLDAEGPDAVSRWILEQNRVFITDTTMRDAHQSLLATRVRTADLLCAAEEASSVLHNAFSFEMWGGATFDVCLRFLHECPWKRLRDLRQKIPNVLFQMLLRGSNAVGYASYPDNVIEKFIQLAAKNGIDVFRIFDCFNDLSQMMLPINTVKACGKIAEVCICFTGNFLSPDERIYTLDYYVDLARRIDAAGAHIIAIKDMAGLFRPQMAEPFMRALRSATRLPIHFHTHNTSSASFTSVVNMAKFGCNIVDLAMASMSDTTSQPSMNAFLATMEGDPRSPPINYLTLEKLDLLWGNIRATYFPFESGLRAGTARVYEHQIPGGQYTNLISQCKSLGIWHRWGEVLDMYRDVNRLFGDIIKVTPSSKCVGDMALFLMSNNMTCADVMKTPIDFPQSVVSLFKGNLGFPHHGFPPELTRIILKGAKPLTVRPGASLPPVDFNALSVELQKKHARPFTEEELISSVFYPKEFDEFVTFTAKFGGDLIMQLPTYTFTFGMKINQTIVVQSLVDSSAPTFRLTLQRIGPLSHENFRTLVFIVNDGQRFETKLKESRSSESTALSPLSSMANPSDPSHIPSPLPGIVDKIYVNIGDKVAKSTVLMSVAAMKMEVQVKAPHDGTVEKICVQVGTKVDNKTLLAQVVELPKAKSSS